MIYIILSVLVVVSVLFVIFISMVNSRRIDKYTDVDLPPAVETAGEYARVLASEKTVWTHTKINAYPMIDRLALVLNKSNTFYRSIDNTQRVLFPASEWLVDNYYLLREALFDAAESLRKETLKTIESDGCQPRIKRIASALIYYYDGAVTAEGIKEFINEYQKEAYLSSQELWLFPSMLRLVLVEYAALTIEKLNKEYEQANKAKTYYNELVRGDMGSRTTLLAKAKTDKNFSNYGLAHLELLIQHSHENERQEYYNWFESLLRARNVTAELVKNEMQLESSENKTSLANVIGTVKMLSNLRWESVYEQLSYVENVYLKEKSDVYSRMDEQSREYYRKRTWEIAYENGLKESSVADAVLALADSHDDELRGHVGYYLVDDGIQELKIKLDLKPERKRDYPAFYISSIIVMTLMFSVLFAMIFSRFGIWVMLSALSTVILPFMDISVLIANKIVCRIFEPVFIPKLEIGKELNEDEQTAVVIPALLTSPESACELAKRMEVYFLANSLKGIRFVLLGDYKDSKTEKADGDAEIIEAASAVITGLNEKYGNIFYFLHRHRTFNANDKIYQGYERKRGALMTFNEFVLGKCNESEYEVMLGDMDGLKKSRLCITLDADTQLVRQSAEKLIGAAVHPLNRPHIYDGRLLRGYTILQPAIGVSAQAAARTKFALYYSGQAGIDSYTFATSDVYMDIANEASFCGKGLYHISAFETLVGGKFPDNAILSHDLIEGSFAGTGLVSDVKLLDDYPKTYMSYAKRLNRWIRGDWQLIPYFCKKVKNKNGEKIKNPISVLAKWKIFDNLRRSVMPYQLTILLITGTLFLPYPLLWIGLLLLTAFLPLIFDAAARLNECMKYRNIRFKDAFRQLKNISLRFFYQFAFLPYEAYNQFDAAGRALWRLAVSHVKMLQWVTAADTETKDDKLRDHIKFMTPVMVIAVTFMLIAVVVNPLNALFALPIALLWLSSPLLAFCLNKSPRKRQAGLSDIDKNNMGMLLRKTWNYFDDFCSSKYNFLPPDNYQVRPAKGAVDRSSPTNIGLALAAAVAAFDRGYITNKRLLEKVNATCLTLERMEKWNGHLFNWYELSTLKVLRPRYVSVVDSGNLAAYLLVTAKGLRDAQKEQIINSSKLIGIKDTLRICQFEYEGKDARIRAEIAHLIDKASLCDGDKDKILEYYEETLKLIRQMKTDGAQRLSSQIGDYINEIESTLHWRKYSNLNFGGEAMHEAAEKLLEHLTESGSPEAFVNGYDETLKLLREIDKLADDETKRQWYSSMFEACELTNIAMNKRMAEAERLAVFCEQMVMNMDFSKLYDFDKELFYIGLDTEKTEPDNVYYDLMASEARQASFIAIAKGDVPQKHWFSLSRTLIEVDGRKALVSWGGTMFEYLMPLLTMPTFDYTLLDETYRTVITAQRAWGERNRLPWGVSESAFYAFDPAMFYQYKAFGIQEIGLKRGLNDDYIVAPYATALAFDLFPAEAVKNIYYLADEGAMGEYGLYDAIDYTRSRIGKEKSAVIYTYMAHHQGMIVMALINCLNDKIMQKRLFSYPFMKACEMLLQEKSRFDGALQESELEKKRGAEDNVKAIAESEIKVHRSFKSCNQSHPVTQLLSNGSLNMVCTVAGASLLKWNDMLVDRWSEDPIYEEGGEHIFIRNSEGDEVWDACGRGMAVSFDEDCAEYKRVDGFIKTSVKVCISPENDTCVRELLLTNTGAEDVHLELTGMHELCMTTSGAFNSHPAFSDMFIRTGFISDSKCLTAVRRKRENNIGMAVGYMILSDDIQQDEVEYETDKYIFIGRTGTSENPVAITERHALGGSLGSVIEPVLALRKRIFVPSDASVKVYFVTSVAESEEELVRIIKKYNSMTSAERAFEMAQTHSIVQLRASGISSDMALMYQNLSSRLIFINPFTRNNNELMHISNGIRLLWSRGISGELPIIVVYMDRESDLYNAKIMLKAHEYYQYKGLAVDLVYLCSGGGYLETVENGIREMVEVSHARNRIGVKGGVYILNYSHMSNEEFVYMKNAAAIFVDGREILNSQLVINYGEFGGEELTIAENRQEYNDIWFTDFNLEYANGLGGFSDNGREYHIMVGDGTYTPAPWSNILANNKIGTIVTESGGGYMWAENSRETKLTPWKNNGMYTECGECVYVRDEDSGKYWTITAAPVRREGKYYVRHGQGYSHYLYNTCGLEQRQSVFIDKDKAVKYTRITIENDSETERHISLTYYIKPVLSNGINSRMNILTADTENDIAFVKNASEQNGYLWASCMNVISSVVLSDHAFIGRNRTMANPRAMRLKKPDSGNKNGQVCIAIRTDLVIKPHAIADTAFICGFSSKKEKIRDIVKEAKNSSVEDAYRNVKNMYDDLLSKIVIKTPNTSMNLMINRWLPYQTLNSRFYARASYYQSGGAIGFRDQLQDCVCLMYYNPDVVRRHILNSAEHQFIEGDVLHWWHEPNRGVRTRITDDLLFLPFVTAIYVRDTGDKSILSEEVRYLDGEELPEGVKDCYRTYNQGDISESLYMHCLRAMDRAYKLGEHGLPLIGTGDWNDAMDNVGSEGKGESVWLAFFQVAVIDIFCEHCMDDKDKINILKERAEELRNAVEAHAWDGEWYMRAFCDDGMPIGSVKSEECRIDMLSQAWSALSETGSYDRRRRALDSVNSNLIDYQWGIAQLLNPPFTEKSDIGYICHYPSGVRENGGQYTHSVAWYIMSLAKMGLGNRAENIFNLINSVNHARTPIETSIYRKEPYVLCADVYSQGPMKGRGGWSWYTGAAAWMYRAGIESILGLEIRDRRINMNPCIPDSWDSYSIEYRNGSTTYSITVHNPDHIQNGVKSIIVDGHTADCIELVDDGLTHKVKVIMG